MRLILAASLFTLTAPGLAAAQQLELAPNQTLLEVQATGEAFVSPDRAILNGGVITFATSSREAVNANAVAMNKVVDALRKAGVDPRDIQTQNLSLNPQFNYSGRDGQPPEITGYQATNSMSVTVRDVRKSAELLTVMFDAGANNAFGPNFSLADYDAATVEARADAVKKAGEQAKAYADAFGMKIVKVHRISERAGGSYYQPIITRANRMAPPPPPPPSPAAVMNVSALSAVEVGEMQQNVTLFVDYILEPRGGRLTHSAPSARRPLGLPRR
ncbi:SIMPL domain-containing protein [Altererythrobacter arenosus]|uniref:SIMPL domain-containing protein n=1 Tax=Altererythrobacter arenosus TaxID=3032592 RepID=A0ABY8FSB2_9SPHN|nr:SIMPL domain-containing protein [Altererythrobacter sp. CAU 1644]WFL76803.1 SIMPL domain-containing protein [Altererythrobacter sp. CAU 1644]